jgi:hypothetical protein
MFNIGAKVTALMPDGLSWPGIIVSDPTSEKKTILNRRTHEPVEIEVVRALVVTLRSLRSDPEATSYRLTTETVSYGYLTGLEPRFNNIVGLDVDADGVILSPQFALDKAREANAAFRANLFEARTAITAAEDL